MVKISVVEAEAIFQDLDLLSGRILYLQTRSVFEELDSTAIDNLTQAAGLIDEVRTIVKEAA